MEVCWSVLGLICRRWVLDLSCIFLKLIFIVERNFLFPYSTCMYFTSNDFAILVLLPVITIGLIWWYIHCFEVTIGSATRLHVCFFPVNTNKKFNNIVIWIAAFVLCLWSWLLCNEWHSCDVSVRSCSEVKVRERRIHYWTFNVAGLLDRWTRWLQWELIYDHYCIS